MRRSPNVRAPRSIRIASSHSTQVAPLVDPLLEQDRDALAHQAQVVDEAFVLEVPVVDRAHHALEVLGRHARRRSTRRRSRRPTFPRSGGTCSRDRPGSRRHRPTRCLSPHRLPARGQRPYALLLEQAQSSDEGSGIRILCSPHCGSGGTFDRWNSCSSFAHRRSSIMGDSFAYRSRESRTWSSSVTGSGRAEPGQREDLDHLAAQRLVAERRDPMALRSHAEAQEGLEARQHRGQDADRADEHPDTRRDVAPLDRGEHAGPGDRGQDDDRDPQHQRATPHQIGLAAMAGLGRRNTAQPRLEESLDVVIPGRASGPASVWWVWRCVFVVRSRRPPVDRASP